MKKIISIIFAMVFCLSLCACSNQKATGKKAVSVLLLPHFEIDALTGDFPGEAQLFYEKYLSDSEQYDISGEYTLYYGKENHIAMCITGSGKVNTAISLTCVLNDSRFDFSESYIIGIGCAGSSIEYTTLGDVCLSYAICDNDLGHTGDPRDLDEKSDSKWFHDESYDDVSFKELNTELIDELYGITKDLKLQTTELSRRVMSDNFDNAEWAIRDPKVIPGSCISSDNYWKGQFDHDKANDICEYYKTEYPYAMTEMEDIAIADVADKFGMLDRTVILRVSVNTDVFMDGATPESLWGNKGTFGERVEDEDTEVLDIFEPAMHNIFDVGSAIIDYLIKA